MALSTTKAKYRVLTEAAKDIVYLQRLLQELQICDTKPTYPLTDNQSNIKLVDNPIFHAQTKHIEIEYHLICQRSQNGDIIVDYISTSKQQADTLTKPLDASLYTHMREILGVKPLKLIS